MKIKDNLNLNGYILQNFCIDNYDSLDGINDKGTGRAVFLTGNSTNAGYGHVNVYDGSGFKALAYLDDVANNEEFLAVKRKVDAFFDGGVDADNVLENLAEVQKFLDNYSGATSLSEILDTKLDKAGGTIDGLLEIKRDISVIKFTEGSTICGYLGVHGKNNPIFMTADGTSQTLLTSEGGTINGALTNGNGKIGIDASSRGAYLGWNENYIHVTGEGAFYNWNKLLHAGNVGDYTAGAANKLVTKADVITTQEDLDAFNQGRIFQIAHCSGVLPSAIKGSDGTVLSIPWNHSGFGAQLAFDDESPSMALRAMSTTSEGKKWSDWKTIAFTDSNVASATKLETPRTIWGQSFDGTRDIPMTSIGAMRYLLFRNTIDTDNAGYIGRGSSSNNDITLSSYGNPLHLVTYDGGIHINSSGNVTIGGSDLALTDHKLFVDGRTSSKGYFFHHINDTVENKGAFLMQYFSSSSSDHLVLSSRNKDYSAKSNILAVDWAKGNLLVGTTTDDESGAKLQVNGTSSFSDTITCTKIHFGSSTGLRYAGKDDESMSANGINWYTKGFGTQVGSIGMVLENNAASYAYIGTSYNNTWLKVSPTGTYATRLVINMNDDGSGARLQVGGSGTFDSHLYVKNWAYYRSYKTDGSAISLLGITGENKVILNDGDASVPTLIGGGNVLIGKTTDNGKGKLQVEGDLHVTGNIIADGEVSAGGAGEEGSGSSSGGGGAFYSETFSAGISTKTITHGLGTEDIVVSIYEKNSTSGKWDMVLTDIEIEDANTIELTFGSATDVEHKVVIMGAVA